MYTFALRCTNLYSCADGLIRIKCRWFYSNQWHAYDRRIFTHKGLVSKSSKMNKPAMYIAPTQLPLEHVRYSDAGMFCSQNWTNQKISSTCCKYPGYTKHIEGPRNWMTLLQSPPTNPDGLNIVISTQHDLWNHTLLFNACTIHTGSFFSAMQRSIHEDEFNDCCKPVSHDRPFPQVYCQFASNSNKWVTCYSSWKDAIYLYLSLGDAKRVLLNHTSKYFEI